MHRAFLDRRWSTTSLVAVSLSLGAAGYVAGHHLATRTRGIDRDPKLRAPIAALSTLRAAISADKSRASASFAVEFGERWRIWVAGPRTPAGERAIAAALEELAGHDPNRAMALALAEGNFRLRESLRNAVLKGWAESSLADAANWALALPEADRRSALEPVFAGAARDPDAAAELGARLCAQNPAMAGEYGQLLVAALTDAGAYGTAAKFAETDTSDNRATWLNASFYQWAAHQPEEALAAMQDIVDGQERSSAFQGLVSGWAESNPAGLATYAMHLPAGGDRDQALGEALPGWVARDPLAASQWMVSNFVPSADFDRGVASVAALPNLVGQQPEIAVGWAENITDPVLRSSTLRSVAQQWAGRDEGAARIFIASVPGLPAEDRAALLEGLEPAPDP
jgi:hypothetical protein